jgi:hypothetical protein
MTKLTKLAYEEYLNDLSSDLAEDTFIIGGKNYLWARNANKYGTVLRQHDSVAFQVGYNDWVLMLRLREENE